MNVRAKRVVLALVLLSAVVALALWYGRGSTRDNGIQGIGKVHRQLTAFLESADFESARDLCSTDFEPQTEVGGSDDTFEDIAHYFTDPKASYSSPWTCESDKGVFYVPDCSWSDGIDILGLTFFEVPSGAYFEFKREKGQWRFTGRVGYFVD